ncbi:MAG: thioredoxin family protein [Isosphaeraceae bacterium]|nr:thioredoxin family protein [Isosphaeraceae bacterium]
MLERPSRAFRAVLRACLGIGLAAGMVSPLRGEEATAIPWRDDFERAQGEARASGRPLWVQFTAPWCAFCRKMEQETFTRPEVAALARERVIPVRVQSEARADLSERFAVEALPTTLILAPGGSVLARHVGFADAAEFRSLLVRSLGPTAGDEGVALAGYSPVSLVQNGSLTRGQADWTATYDGQVFRFANAEERDAFLREPEKFLPADGGRCVVNHKDRGISIPGDARFGVYYRGRLYLCADEAARQRFARDPERYRDADLAEQGYCPHCRGRQVRGLPQFATTYAGRRYLFPDPSHLEAFRAAPDRYLR